MPPLGRAGRDAIDGYRQRWGLSSDTAALGPGVHKEPRKQHRAEVMKFLRVIVPHLKPSTERTVEADRDLSQARDLAR